MTFEKIYTPEQRQLVHSLKSKGLTGMEVVGICAGPSDEHRGGLERFELTKDTANRIHREESEALRVLTTSPLADDPDATEKLRKAVIAQAEAELDRVRRRRDRGRIADLDKLAAIVLKLHKLDGPAKAVRTSNGEASEAKEEPKSFLESLAEAT